MTTSREDQAFLNLFEARLRERLRVLEQEVFVLGGVGNDRIIPGSLAAAPTRGGWPAPTATPGIDAVKASVTEEHELQEMGHKVRVPPRAGDLCA